MGLGQLECHCFALLSAKGGSASSVLSRKYLSDGVRFIPIEPNVKPIFDSLEPILGLSRRKGVLTRRNVVPRKMGLLLAWLVEKNFFWRTNWANCRSRERRLLRRCAERPQRRPAGTSVHLLERIFLRSKTTIRHFCVESVLVIDIRLVYKSKARPLKIRWGSIL